MSTYVRWIINVKSKSVLLLLSNTSSAQQPIFYIRLNNLH